MTGVESERGRRGDDAVTALALAAGRGDRRALDEFVRATQGDVWRFCAHLADVASADDLTQETYLRALRTLPRFSARSSARTWLLAIARRVAVDQIRHAMSRPRIADGACVEGAADRRGTRRFEGVVELNLLIDGLDPERREALFLTQMLGLPYAEAAAVVGCPVGTIRSRVSRARADLLAATDTESNTG